MTNEEKQLLIKDLCARLPYGVIVHFHDINVDDYDRQLIGEDLDYIELDGRSCKPYLRPISSMTEEEKNERNFYCGYKPYYEEEDCGERYLTEYDMPDYIDWLNTHHFDYRGLIPMGLALEAPEGMYKKEESK